ncbi:MAG: aldo/keto reductase, partial [Planctomycetes bacterium]|nr:aldo/keto reductase [Planctomycetota bacterium]
FDTANVYGEPKGQGVTEQLIGRWLAQGDGRREKIVLATKCYASIGALPHQRGNSARNIRDSCDQSLRRLGVDTIDLFQMHHIDYGQPTQAETNLFGLSYAEQVGRVDHGPPWEEIWQAMDQLVTAGKVLYIGSSNFAAWNLAQANGVAAARNTLGLVSEQSKYNLATRMVELEVVPACRALGLGLIPYSPIGGGLLAGVLDNPTTPRRSKQEKAVEKHRPQLEAYEALCRRIERQPAEVALAWLLHNPVVTAPIIGPRNVEQLDGVIETPELELPPEVLAELDEIWPGPGGEAPAAYAW